jgi:hypothetical protein
MEMKRQIIVRIATRPRWLSVMLYFSEVMPMTLQDFGTLGRCSTMKIRQRISWDTNLEQWLMIVNLLQILT